MNVENIKINVESNADKAAKKLDALYESLSKLSGVAASVKPKELEGLATAVSTISNAKITAGSFNSLAKGIEKISDALGSLTESDVEILDKVATSLARLQGVDLTGFSKAVGSVGKVRDVVAASERPPVSPELQAVISSADKIQVLEAKLYSLKAALQDAFASGDTAKAFALRGQIIDVERQLESAKEAAKETQGAFVSLGSVLKGSVSDALKGVGNAFRRLGSDIKSALQAIGSAIPKAFGSLFSGAKRAAASMGQLFKSLKRIAVYRLMRTIIKEIGKAFKEGLKNAYDFSKGIDGTLSKALDNLSSQSTKMKNQLGAAFGNLLQIAMPVILRLIELITRLASAVSALLSVFGGGQYLVAKDVEASWDAATGAAKKYKNTVLSFDELNKLNDESGGGGGNSVDASNMFELGTLSEELQNFKDTIKSLYDSEAFLSLGGFVAEKINEAFKSIDLWSIGETLGEKINNAISVALGFVERIDLRAISSSLFAAFSHMLSEIDFTALGEVVASKLTLLGDFLLGALYGINWETVGESIGNFFRGIFDHVSEWLDSVDWDKTGQDIFKAIKNLIEGIDFPSLAASFWEAFTKAINAAIKLASGFRKALTEWIGKQNWVEVGDEFYKNLKTAFEGINFGEIAKSIFSLLGAALGAAVAIIGEFIKGVRDDICEYFKQYFTDSNGDDMYSGGEIIMGVLKGILYALRDIGVWIYNNVVVPFVNGFKDAFGIHSPAKVMEEPGDSVGKGILEGILKPFKDIVNWIKTNVADPLIEAAKSALGISNGESTTFSDIGGDIVNGLLNGLKKAWESVTSWFSSAWDGIKNWWNGLSLGSPTINAPKTSGFSVDTRAEGGFPSMGSLFVAGENGAGAEFVGNIGGRTGVVNSDQMSEAVAEGNSNVVGAVYAMADAIVSAINNKDMDVELDGATVARLMYHPMQNEANRRGGSLVMGGVY